ncbi:uncharacterized protein LOC126579806 [Anopheles aquasalis]|uniref:uncharacterized protein LOC126579806 n=1 Tax=Anopheles aquasalis TaxID=42839 RepID=UPI00215A8A15|nr:uncharacterized protein LOC126579806 [Anopheles aquasalis]
MALSNHSCPTRSSRPCTGSDGQWAVAVAQCLPQRARHEQLNHHHLRKHHHQQPSTTTTTTGPLTTAMATTLNSTATTATTATATSRRGPRWRPWRLAIVPLPLVLLLLLLLAWPGVTTGAPVTKDTTEVKMLENFLKRNSNDWLSPCTVPSQPTNVEATLEQQQQQPQNNTDTSDVRRKIVVAMMENTQLALVTISQFASDLNSTGWNTAERQQVYSFLRPFVSNETTWERRLSVYWAFLAFIVNVCETHSSVVRITPGMLEDMRALRNYIKDILCQLREYKSFAGFHSQPIQAARMSKLIQFDEVDLNNIHVVRWFVLCRLNCYLNSSYLHLKHLSESTGSDPRAIQQEKKIGKNCQLCPYLARKPGAPATVPHQATRKQQRKQKDRKKDPLGVTGNNNNKDLQQQQQQQPSRTKPKNKAQSGAGKKATNQAGGKRRKGVKQGKKQKQQQQQGALAAVETHATVNQRVKAKTNRKRKNHQNQGQGQGQQQQRHAGGGAGKRPNRVQD